jgi:D-amino-acid oxidase
VPHYLQYLVSRLLALGVVFQRAFLGNILEAQFVHHSSQPASLVINCTGLGARSLGGVADKAMSPGRGQTVLVRNIASTQGSLSSPEHTNGEFTYLMTRAVAGGTILGGCYQEGNWSKDVDEELAKRIMKRAVEFCPELVKDGPLDVISHNVGFRPARDGGVRVEGEILRNADGSTVQVFHNYGHGGSGYQMSYGCSAKVVELVKDYVVQLNKQQSSLSSKL